MGWKMDWRKFRQFLASEYGVTKAYMFIGYIVENEKLYEQIHEAGYLVVLKPTVDTSKPLNPSTEPAKPTDDPDVARKSQVKGNIDAELVLWAVKEMPHYSKAVIVSGDGDFYCLAEYLLQQGKLAKLLTPNWQYSTLLKPFDQYIVRLDQKRQQLQYRTFHRKKPAQ